MKKVILLLAISSLFSSMLLAQSNPEGMNYQAVARNTKGEILADQPIALKVTLFSMKSTGKTEYYKETHDVVTSATGVFSLVIGRGTKESGVYEDIPWSKENIWMEVSIKSKGQSDFVAISNSKLLAVPYAYYAFTAGQVAGSVLQDNGASAKGTDFAKCPCEGGLSQIKVLYLGPAGVTVNVYGKKDQHDLLATFNGVNNGDILTVNANNYPDGKFKNETYFEVLSAGISIVEINTECEELKEPWEMSLGETFGNFSVLSHRDRKNNAECTVCDLKKEWHVGGNGLMDMCNWLGTKSNTDLILITNNLERMRIAKNGDIDIKKSLHIGANLTVDSTVKLNVIGGETINHGMFSVDGATDLNSSLNVDGITDLNSRLSVNNMSPTLLTGTLHVKGITDLDSALNVNGMNPTLLTGTLQVNKDASFYEKIKILSTHQTDTAGGSPSGSLQVGGGAYIAKNLYIGGIAKFGGPAAFGGAVTITDATESISTSTGALIIPYGGVGIGKRLNVGGGGLFQSTLGVAGLTSLTNITESNTKNDGALVLAGGAGIGKNVNIGGALTTTGITTLNNTLNVNSSSSYIANFVNSSSSGNGISIQVGAGTPNNDNNFVTFRNSGGGIVGRIEGETLGELVNNDDYKVEKKSLDLAVSMATIDVVTGGIGVIMAGVDLVGAASSSTACAGLGVCVTAPVPSLIIAAGINLATAIADEVSVAIGLDDAITQRNYFVNTAASNVGVTYQSGSGDYAEWLPKANPSEKFKAGFIVGMKNGQISLNSAGADKLFVISTKPIVLGNMPDEGKEAGYEKVAFMGQVPVHVIGKVNAGDYILPSGFNNGFGKAVAPEKMKADDYAKIVGMAWSSSATEGYNLINVAIGLNAGDISKVVAEQSKEISELKGQINEINNTLAKLASGVKETGIAKIENPVKTPVFNPNGKNQHPVDFVKQDAGTIVYFDITTEQTTTMLDMAQKLFIEKGGDVNTHPFWKRINTDPGYKDVIMTQIKNTFRNGMHTHQEINSKSSLQSTK